MTDVKTISAADVAQTLQKYAANTEREKFAGAFEFAGLLTVPDRKENPHENIIRKKAKYELWINVSDNFLYFETDQETIEEAWEEFRSRLDKIGCVSDNFGYTQAELRKWAKNGGDYEVIERDGK